MQVRALSLSLLMSTLAQQAVATPPACLLLCAQEIAKSSSSCNLIKDIPCMCENEADAMNQCLEQRCPNDLASTAESAFEQVCKDVGSSASGSSAVSSKTTSTSQVSSKADRATSLTEEPTTTSAPPTSSEVSTTTTESVAPTTESTTTSESVAPTTESSAAPTTVSTVSVSSTSSGPTVSQFNDAPALVPEHALGMAAVAVLALL